MRKHILIILLLTFWTTGNTQNLVPDGNFTSHSNMDCPPHYLALENSKHWYASGNTTVDLFMAGCNYDSGGTSPVSKFWEYQYITNSFLGFWGVFRSNYTMGSEVFGTALREDLRSDYTYYLSAEIRYRGKGHPEKSIFPYYCPTEPPLALQVYTSNEPIRSQVGDRGAATKVFANNVLTLDSPSITDTIVTDEWTPVSGCFTTQDGDNHLGFSLTIDSFDAVVPCIGPFDDTWISMSYYNIDNVELFGFPNLVVDTLLFCQEKARLEFNAMNYFGDIDSERFELVWEDGTFGTTRVFNTPGFHRFTMNHICGATDFEIYLDEQKCEAQALVPDAFTPNFDGRNDELFPFFVKEQAIANYEFSVFDRWGNLFYQSDVYDGFTGWDGTVNGKPAQNGVYVWSLRFDLLAPDETKSYQLSGDVLLIR